MRKKNSTPKKAISKPLPKPQSPQKIKLMLTKSTLILAAITLVGAFALTATITYQITRAHIYFDVSTGHSGVICQK